MHFFGSINTYSKHLKGRYVHWSYTYKNTVFAYTSVYMIYDTHDPSYLQLWHIRPLTADSPSKLYLKNTCVLYMS